MSGTLFDTEPEQGPVAIRFEGYAVAFDGYYGMELRVPQQNWELDTDTICETREAAEELMREWADDAGWKIVKVTIEAHESPIQTNP